MFVNPYIRQLVGGLLCGLAALSLVSMLLPSALAFFGLTDPFSARLALSAYAVHVVLAWALGGWWTARRPGLKSGGAIMGVLGVASGALLAALGFGLQPPLLAVSTACAGFYGLTVGLLVGHLLSLSPT